MGSRPRRTLTPEVRGSEQGERRRCLAISGDDFNSSAAGLVVIVAISTQDKSIRSHIRIDPPEGGQTKTGFIKPETIRHIAKERLLRRHGIVRVPTMQVVEHQLRDLLWLD